jgi:hypothetical protein
MRRNAFYLWGLLFSASLLVGCSDDEDDNEEVYDEVMTDYTASRFDSVANALLQADDTGDDTKYSMIYGEVLDESTPKVRTIAVNSYAEAFSWFINHCVPSDERENYKDVMGEITIDLDEYGSITYHPSETNDLYASITLNLSVLPDVNRLDIISSSLWPQNIYSSVALQSLVYDTKGITLSNEIQNVKLYYICVREYAGGQPGILLCLNPEWWIDEDKLYDKLFYYRRDGYDYTTNFPKYLPSEDAWKAIAQLYYENADHFRTWLDILTQQKVKDGNGTIKNYDTFPLNGMVGSYINTVCTKHPKVFHIPYEKTVYQPYFIAGCYVKCKAVAFNAKYIYVDTEDNNVAKYETEELNFCKSGNRIPMHQIPIELRFGAESGRFTAIYQPEEE